jgi:thiamine pyrophosphate-dependent acetolactate synthase large subunit-like protein
MGICLPAAIGAKMGMPNREVVCYLLVMVVFK